MKNETNDYRRAIVSFVKGAEFEVDSDETFASLDARTRVTYSELETIQEYFTEMDEALDADPNRDPEMLVEICTALYHKDDYFHGGRVVETAVEWIDNGHNLPSMEEWTDAGVWDVSDVPDGASIHDLVEVDESGRPIFWYSDRATKGECRCNEEAYEDASKFMADGACGQGFGILAFISAMCRGKYDELDVDIHDSRRPSGYWGRELSDLEGVLREYHEDDRPEAIARHIARRILADEFEGIELEVARATLKIAELYTSSRMDRWVLAAQAA